MNPVDVQVDVFRSGIGCPVMVRVTHRPTGLSASRQDVAQIRAREAALRDLEVLVAARLRHGRIDLYAEPGPERRFRRGWDLAFGLGPSDAS